MYCGIILGSNKTTVSVATGNIEYHPLYISISNPHNSVRRAHNQTIIPIAFLAIPKGMLCCVLVCLQFLITIDEFLATHKEDNNTTFRSFKKKLFHASISAILQPVKPAMITPVVCRCPDGHWHCVIFDLAAFIVDYPKEVMLSGIVQGWCSKCVPHSTTSVILVMSLSLN